MIELSGISTICALSLYGDSRFHASAICPAANGASTSSECRKRLLNPSSESLGEYTWSSSVKSPSRFHFFKISSKFRIAEYTNEPLMYPSVVVILRQIWRTRCLNLDFGGTMRAKSHRQSASSFSLLNRSGCRKACHSLLTAAWEPQPGFFRRVISRRILLRISGGKTRQDQGAGLSELRSRILMPLCCVPKSNHYAVIKYSCCTD